MTVEFADLGLYAFALFILFLTPGPVWLAVVARAMAGGFHAAWPLALGVVVGDVFWPLLAILSLSWITSTFSGLMTVLRFGAAVFFLWMGWTLIRNRDQGGLSTNSHLTQPGMWAGFAVGVAVILGNPKAMLFYLGILPGFFDLSALVMPDIAAIVLLSLMVPLLGNIVLALMVDHVRSFVQSPRSLRRLNIASGGLLIGVGLLIPFT